MTKRVLGVLAALSMVVGAVACSSSSDSGGGTPAKDSGVTDTGKTDAKTDGPSVVDGGGTDGGGTVTDKTTGKACTTDDECDVTGNGVNFCASSISTGSLYPTPVCIGRECEIPDPTKISLCDSDTGVCLSTGSGNICLGACTFDDTGAAPKGCEGNNACAPYGWGTDSMTMAIQAIGFCWGGCKADSDCKAAGMKCQVEEGLCVKTPDVYTLKVGDACTKADSTAKPPKCNCLYATASGNGACTQFCKMGDTGACPTGFACDAGLPKTAKMAGDTVFTKAPAGLAGNCMKICTADSDCGTWGYCDENAGVGAKTCQVGTRM